MILAILRILALSDALSHGVMDQPGDPTPASVALVHSYHARAAATVHAPATLLLAIGYKESRYKPVSRPQCGVTQIAAKGDRAFCRALVADPGLAYATAANHIDYWWGVCRGRGRDRMACALTGYGGGTRAASGRPAPYARNTLWRAGVIGGAPVTRRQATARRAPVLAHEPNV